uniref:Uncharacterized protein n=1 Tax=Rhizobium rhizogenes TaxID=359 RepID=A0A4P8DK40_RHIRH|nr:hypothetical protein pOC-C5.8_569 [Rhizobium rhizogenes]
MIGSRLEKRYSIYREFCEGSGRPANATDHFDYTKSLF